MNSENVTEGDAKVGVGVEKDKKELVRLAKKLLAPQEKNPYYLGDKCVCNLRELRQNMDAFSEREAEWIAAWIEYLGDGETAQKIRGEPSNFKSVIINRYAELKTYR